MKKLFVFVILLTILFFSGCERRFVEKDKDLNTDLWNLICYGELINFQIVSDIDNNNVSYIFTFEKNSLICKRVYEVEKIKAGQNGRLYRTHSSVGYYYIWRELKAEKE